MINNKIIKVCGLRDADNIRQVESLGIDWTGFIFYPGSPRYVDRLPSYLPASCKRVGVFVNQDRLSIEATAERFALDYIQLHGSESPEYCLNIRPAGIKLIKAFPINTPADFQVTQTYEGVCDYYLFDTRCEQYGGSGRQFDWDMLSAYNGKTPFLLSGGIDQYSAGELKKISHSLLVGFDLNSRFEASPGIKDTRRIKFFIDELR